MTRTSLFGLPYAVDNECFTLGDAFDGARFVRALQRIKEVHGLGQCLFVTSPDVVGNAMATLARFAEWQPIIKGLGFPVALAGQDGCETLDIPWNNLDALFIGGSTEWKLSQAVADLISEAKVRGKWTHMGRVNSTRRASRLREMPDSVDGTAWVKHPTEYARQWQKWVLAGMPSFVGVLF